MGLSHVPRTDVLPCTAGTRIPQGKGAVGAPWGSTAQLGGEERGGHGPSAPSSWGCTYLLVAPHTSWLAPAPGFAPQHQAAGKERCKAVSWGGHTHPPHPIKPPSPMGPPAHGEEGSVGPSPYHQFCTWLPWLPALGWPGGGCSTRWLCPPPGSWVVAGLPTLSSFQDAWCCPLGWAAPGDHSWPRSTSLPPSSGSGPGSGAGCSSTSTRVPETTAAGGRRGSAWGKAAAAGRASLLLRPQQAPGSPAHTFGTCRAALSILLPLPAARPGAALAPDTHSDRALPPAFMGTHPGRWVSGGLPPAGCIAPASQPGHAPAPLRHLAHGPGESRG